jgi:pyruvate dehydrogenase E1 component alpha subunit
MGADMKKMMAEIFGKATGYCKGKGGSMHIADVDYGNLGSNGVVAAGIPIAVGSALTAQLDESDAVTVCFFGDGATNEGSFHEALNLASIWKLPVIFVCENNQYGMSSAITEMTNIKDLSIRASSYGIPGTTIDGNDLLQVIQTTEEAVNRARNGDGPTFIEAKTYRYNGHSKSDKQVYRAEEEVAEWKRRDPIIRFEQLLQKANVLSDHEADKIKEHVRKQVDEALDFAINSPEPPLEELLTDVYAP